MNEYKVKQIDHIETRDGELLPIQRGWNDLLARRLVEQSRQAEILKWTPRDAAERFVTVPAADQWYRNANKMPITYSLGLTAIRLPGFAWFSIQKNKETPGANVTFGIRIYEGYNGRGLARPFAEAVHNDMDHQYGAGVWLETDMNNTAAYKLYEHLGYVAVNEMAGNRILMARQPADLL